MIARRVVTGEHDKDQLNIESTSSSATTAYFSFQMIFCANEGNCPWKLYKAAVLKKMVLTEL